MEMADDYHRKLNDSQAALEFIAHEVERLSRELTAANESRHMTELVAAEWKGKYETARLEWQELEQALFSTRSKVSKAETDLETVQHDASQLLEDKTSSDVMAEALRDEIAALKNIVNQQKLDKAELETVILTQRYSEHPGNVARPPSDTAADTHSHGIDSSLLHGSLFISYLAKYVLQDS